MYYNGLHILNDTFRQSVYVIPWNIHNMAYKYTQLLTWATDEKGNKVTTT